MAGDECRHPGQRLLSGIHRVVAGCPVDVYIHKAGHNEVPRASMLCSPPTAVMASSGPTSAMRAPSVRML